MSEFLLNMIHHGYVLPSHIRFCFGFCINEAEDCHGNSSFHHVEPCRLEDRAFGILKGFLANNKADATPQLEGAVITGCWKAVCLLFMKVSPQERAFNYIWKFIMV